MCESKLHLLATLAERISGDGVSTDNTVADTILTGPTRSVSATQSHTRYPLVATNWTRKTTAVSQ